MRPSIRPIVPVLLFILACQGSRELATDTADSTGPSGDATGSAPASCPDDLEPILTIEAYAEAIAAATCARKTECGCTPAADCVQEVTAAQLSRFQQEVDAGNVYDGLCARKRVLGREWVSCDIDSTSPCGCDDFAGTLAEGAACDDSLAVERCGPGLFCNGGTCDAFAAIPLVEDGEPCWSEMTGELIGACKPESICNLAVDGVCVPQPQVGDPCVNYTCGLSAWCNRTDIATGVCTALRPAGEPCSSLGQCESFECVDFVCTDAPRICLFF